MPQFPMSLPKKLAIAFPLVNSLFWSWFLWLFHAPQLNTTIEAGIGVTIVGLILMGPGVPLFFVVVGMADLIFLKTGIAHQIGETQVELMMIVSGLAGWSAAGYGIGVMLTKRSSRRARVPEGIDRARG